MTRKDTYRVKAITRRRVLEATVAGSALVAAPPFLRRALAAGLGPTAWIRAWTALPPRLRRGRRGPSYTG